MKIQAIRGMQDLPPKKKRVYRFAEDVIRGVLESYCYKEIGVPVVESTDLFHRLVGRIPISLKKKCIHLKIKWRQSNSQA